jgi:hypothetical protein
MIRTTLSFCALFGSLLLVSKLMQQSSSPAASDAPIATAPARNEATSRRSVETARKVVPSKTTRFDGVPTLRPTGLGTTGAIRQVAFEEEAVNAEGQPIGRFQQSLDLDPSLEVATKPTQAADIDEILAELAVDPNAQADDESEDADGTVAADDSGKEVEMPADADSEIKPPAELTAEMIELRSRIRECLAHYYHRPENVATRSPWGTMHGMIAYGVDTQVIAGNRQVNAIGWLCYNGTCNGQQLFHTSNRRLQARIGVGVQGHAGQFLSMLAQSRVKTDFPMKVDGLDFTVADLIQHEKETCRPNTELTFKLISLVHYLKSDEKWTSNDGQDWDIPRLIQEELKQPIVGAACGGTHRMTGFSYAVRKREQRKEEFSGQWLRAKKFVEAYHEYTFRLQNPDGSFSTDWFAGRADFGPPSRRLETTGHITEWLAFSLSPEELRSEQMVTATRYLTELLLTGKNEKWAIGPLGHGLHALAIYDERVFGGKPGERGIQLARERGTTLDK